MSPAPAPAPASAGANGRGATLVVDGLRIERARRLVVDQVGFTAHAGAVTALIGPNGAGKSTVLKAILGLIAPAAGTVRLDGIAIAGLARRQRARLLGYVPQRSQLAAGMSVTNVVATGRFAHQGALARLSHDDRAAIAEALAMVDAVALQERRFDELSGGESQRVLLARALCTGAGTILLDEPTAGLDIGHALRALNLLRQLADHGRTVLVVLHQLDEVRRIADHAVLLHHGTVLSQGAPAEVLSAAPLRRAFGVEPEPGAPFAFRLSQGDA
jgi:iron complex transport system ATP-binding protein